MSDPRLNISDVHKDTWLDIAVLVFVQGRCQVRWYTARVMAVKARTGTSLKVVMDFGPHDSDTGTLWSITARHVALPHDVPLSSIQAAISTDKRWLLAVRMSTREEHGFEVARILDVTEVKALLHMYEPNLRTRHQPERWLVDRLDDAMSGKSENVVQT